MADELTWEFGVSHQLRNGFHNYILLETELDVRTYEFEMIRNNRNLCLLSATINQGVVKYDVSDLFSLENSIVQHLSDVEWFEHMMKELLKIMNSLDNYLLQADSICLDPRLVFLDDKHRTVSLFYIPNYQGNIQKEFCSLIEYLMKKIDHSQKQLVSLIYGLYHIVQDSSYSLQRVQEYLKEYALKDELLQDGQTKIVKNRFMYSDQQPAKQLEQQSDIELEQRLEQSENQSKIDFTNKGIKSNSLNEKLELKNRVLTDAQLNENVIEKQKKYDVKEQKYQRLEQIIITTMVLICCCIGCVYCYNSIFLLKTNMGIYWFWAMLLGSGICLCVDVWLVSNYLRNMKAVNET